MFGRKPSQKVTFRRPVCIQAIIKGIVGEQKGDMMLIDNQFVTGYEVSLNTRKQQIHLTLNISQLDDGDGKLF